MNKIKIEEARKAWREMAINSYYKKLSERSAKEFRLPSSKMEIELFEEMSKVQERWKAMQKEISERKGNFDGAKADSIVVDDCIFFNKLIGEK